MAGREGARVGVFGKNTSGGLLQAPTVCLRRTAEVTSKGVFIRAAGHPQHWVCLRPSGTGTEGHFHTSPISGHRRGNTREGSHPLSRETGRPGPPRLDNNRP